MSMRCLMTRTSRLAVSSYAQNLLGGDSARRSFCTALLPTLASSRRSYLPPQNSVLRIISTSSGEGGGNEKPDDELEIVLEEIKEARTILAKYEDDLWGDGEKGVTAAMVDTRVNTLNLLLAKEARLEASSAPSRDAPPEKSRPLEVRFGTDDFLSLKGLEEKKSVPGMAGLPEKSKYQLEFVGKDTWLINDALPVVKFGIDDYSVGDDRVSPAAFVGQSRSGKTRALMEVGSKLRSEGQNVIFVSFNGATTYQKGESSSVLDSLLARIGYAIAKPEAIAGRRLHDDGDDGKLQFTTTAKAVVEWLAKNNVTLLIDELNAAVDPKDKEQADPVAFFLTKNFISKAGRFLVFTTHFASVFDVVEFMGGTPTSGVVQTLGLPLVETQEDVLKLTNGRGIAGGAHPGWYGFSPALIAAASKESSYRVKRRAEEVESKRRRAFGELKKVLNETGISESDLYREIVTDVFEPSKTDDALVPSFERFAPRVSRAPLEAARRAWPPVALVYVLEEVPNLEKGESSATDSAVRRGVVEKLRGLKSAKHKSGDAWDIASTCAIMLRVDLLRFAKGDSFFEPGTPQNCLLPDDLVDALRVSTDRRAMLAQTVDFQSLSATDAVAKLRNDKPLSYPAVTFLLPKDAQFDTYDMLLAYYPAVGVPPIVCGYQYRSGKKAKMPEKKTLAGVDKSFVILFAEPTEAQKEKAPGWTVLSSQHHDAFLGPTLAPLIRFERGMPKANQPATKIIN